jgi:hypothetical protein
MADYGDMKQVMDILREALPSGVPPPCGMTLRRMADQGEIGSYWRGRRIFFNLDDVQAWADSGFERTRT